MTTTSTFCGIGEDQRVSSRVLKPPGGGSSISFGGDSEEDFMKPKAKVAPMTQAPKEQPKESPKPDTNGMDAPQKDNSAATKENNPTPATNGTNGTDTNGTVVNGSGVNGSAENGSTVNGVNGTNGISSTPTSPTSNGVPNSGCSTPSSARLDTQSRLFGDEPRKDTPSRRVRDHQRSNIFTADGEDRLNGHSKGSPRAVFSRTWSRRDPVTGVGVQFWDIHAPRFAPNKRKAMNNIISETPTPEPKSPEQPQPQQKQRIPPGGFSTKLW